MIQVNQEFLGHPQQPRQAQLWRVQQVLVILICLYAIFQRQIDLKRSQCDTVWSRGSWTPSVTSTSSTIASRESTSYVHRKVTGHMFIMFMVSTASTSYFHQKLTWHLFICYFSKTNRFKSVPAWYRLIKSLSDTLSDLDKLNYGEYSNY